MARLVTITVGPFEDFVGKLESRMKSLAAERGEKDFAFPVGLLLIIDEENGGNHAAAEVVRRLHLLGRESKNVIDFYYLGWKIRQAPPSEGQKISTPEAVFDLGHFMSCRISLASAGMKKFGGNADLILVDAEWRNGSSSLRFDRAIQIDLSRLEGPGPLSSLGAFFQALIEISDEIQAKGGRYEDVTLELSDRLGLLVAKHSAIQFLLDKFGGVVGASRLSSLVTKSVGPAITLERLRTFGTDPDPLSGLSLPWSKIREI